MKLLLLIPLTGFVLLAGCAAPVLREMPDDPNYAPFEANSALPEFQSKGSIQYARFGTSLFSDRRAAQIGDIITVRLQEKTQASKDWRCIASIRRTGYGPHFFAQWRPAQ